jgi:hypothetical protein
VASLPVNLGVRKITGAMRVFLLITSFAIAIFNCFLGYSGTVLSAGVRRTANVKGVDFSNLAELASGLQPWFYLLAFCALAVGVLGLRKKLCENQLIYLMVFFLVTDILALWISTWGFGTVFLLLCAFSCV